MKKDLAYSGLGRLNAEWLLMKFCKLKNRIKKSFRESVLIIFLYKKLENFIHADGFPKR